MIRVIDMKILPLTLLLLLSSANVYAQADSAATSSAKSNTNFFSQWEARTSRVQSKQPAWPPPLVTTYVGLFQVLRIDVLRQIAPARTDTWNFGNSKGVSLIPGGNVEFDINMPPYIEHNTTAKDGAGDFSVLGKYRLASGNAKHGTYVVSAWALATFPTGSYKNGSTNPTVAPTLGGGKGFGNFDVQSSIGATLPTGNPATNTAGRPIIWNTAAQYKTHKIFWPELESNATFYHGGPNDGKIQEFITPGVLIGKCAFHPSDPKSRVGATVGAGMQIATSRFHTYNHELVITGRLVF
jgi:hypothetical protein